MSGKGEEILTEEQQADFLLQTKLRLKSFGFITDDSLEEENPKKVEVQEYSFPLIEDLRKQVSLLISKYGFEDLMNVKRKTNLRDRITDKNNFEMFLVNNLELLQAIIATTANEDFEKVSGCLVRIFVANDCSREVVHSLIKEEVRNHRESFMTMFREDNLRIKTISNYFKLVGKPYLRRILSPIILNIEKNNKKLIKQHNNSSNNSINHIINNYNNNINNNNNNHNNNSSSNLTLEKNSPLILEITDLVIQKLNENVTCPAYIRIACFQIKEELTIKAPEIIVPSLGNLLFLRWIGPALVQPQEYGVIDFNPSFESKRILILVAKILQSIVNGICNPEINMENLDNSSSLRCSRVLNFLISIAKNANQITNFVPSDLQAINQDEISTYEEVRVQRDFAVQNIYQYVNFHFDEIERIWLQL